MEEQRSIYTVTNEDLASIVKGLDIRESDLVLSIAASGDQPLALLEGAGKVVAVDKYRIQLAYARRQAELIRIGNYKRFLKKTRADYMLMAQNQENPELEKPYALACSERQKYFSAPGRLDRIRTNINKLEFRLADIYGMENEAFDKIYVSNTIYYRPMQDRLDKIVALLNIGGLLYVTNGDILEGKGWQPPGLEEGLSHLRIDERLTRGLNGRSMWKPVVLRKVT